MRANVDSTWWSVAGASVVTQSLQIYNEIRSQNHANTCQTYSGKQHRQRRSASMPDSQLVDISFETKLQTTGKVKQHILISLKKMNIFFTCMNTNSYKL